MSPAGISTTALAASTFLAEGANTAIATTMASTLVSATPSRGPTASASEGAAISANPRPLTCWANAPTAVLMITAEATRIGIRVTVTSQHAEVLVQSWNSGLMLPPQWRELAPSASEALAMAVRDAVLDGKIRAADQLPAERRLASQLGVSRGTVVAAFARLRAEGWLSTRRGSGSTVQIPASLRLRYEPLPAVHAEGLIDLRRATPAAPVDAYTAAAQRALGRSARLLLGDGEPGPGLPELREQVAARLTGQGLPTGPNQVLITAGARAAMTLLTAYLRPNTAVVESPAFYGILAILRRPGRQLVPVAVGHDGWDAGQLAAAFGQARGGMAMLVPDQDHLGGPADRLDTRTGPPHPPATAPPPVPGLLTATHRAAHRLRTTP